MTLLVLQQWNGLDVAKTVCKVFWFVCFALFYFSEVEERSKEALSIISKDQCLRKKHHILTLSLQFYYSFIRETLLSRSPLSLPSHTGPVYLTSSPENYQRLSPTGLSNRSLGSTRKAPSMSPSNAPCLWNHLWFSLDRVSCSLPQALTIFCSFSSCSYLPIISMFAFLTRLWVSWE